MNVAERLAQYENRGFDRATASINVLLEETLQALFKKYPNTFVFFGGASLAIFYGSTRHSGDLDLLTCFGSPPGLDELRGTLQRPLTEICELLGFASPAIEPLDSSGDVKKLAVKSGNNALFTIDLTNISTVIRTELVEFTIPSGSGPTTKITVPSKDFQLLLKLEAFLTRRFVKARDAFDIKLLLDSGAGLHESLRDHLIDGPAGEKIEDTEFIAARIEQVNARSCKVELQPYLPIHVYKELEEADFEPLRRALRDVFSGWL